MYLLIFKNLMFDSNNLVSGELLSNEQRKRTVNTLSCGVPDSTTPDDLIFCQWFLTAQFSHMVTSDFKRKVNEKPSREGEGVMPGIFTKVISTQ